MKTPEENGHIHDFPLDMKLGDTHSFVRSTINGNPGDYHDHEVTIWFDVEKKKFIIDTMPNGGSFRTMHTHPQMEVDIDKLDPGILR